MLGFMTSPRIYQIDPSRSTWRLHVGDTEIRNVAGELRELNGNLVFNAEDASASRLDLWTATAAGRLWRIRFLSWRFREVGRREYWVPGALTIGDLTKVVSLRVRGPTPETTDAHGNLRAGATALTVLDPTQAVSDPAPGMLVTLRFEIELVRRMPAESKRVAA